MLNKNTNQKSNFWKTGLLLPFLFLFIFIFNVKTEAQVKKPKVVSVSYSYDPDMHFAIITKDATNKDLEELKKEFSKNGTTLEFTKVERSAKGQITNLVLTYENKKTGNTGSISQTDSKGIPGFTLTEKDGWFSHKTLIGQKNAEGTLMGVGNSPLYIIEGKEYSTAQLADKYVEIKGEWSVLKPKEAEEQFGSRAKDGAIIISESNIIEDFKAGLKDVDLKKMRIRQTFIQVNKDAAPILMNLKTEISQNPTNSKSNKFELQDVDFLEEPNEINAIQRDKITFSNFSFQESRPLIVVGGEIKEKDYTLTIIEPTEIKSINVLKGESATEKYGEQAENGAIEIELSADGEVLEEKKAKQSQNSEKKDVQFTADSIKFKVSENPARDGTEVKISNVHEAKFSQMDALYVVNGKVMPKNFDPESIDHNNIQSVTVLKGAKAVEKYGKKANKGVLEIITEK